MAQTESEEWVIAQHHFMAGYNTAIKELKQQGWHRSSDLPPRYKEVIVICRTSFTDGTTHQALGYARYTDNGWDREDVKWWCFPPL